MNNAKTPPAPLSPATRSLAQRLLVGLVLLVIAGVYTTWLANTANADWRWDDTQILLTLDRYSLAALFLDPQAWQTFSVANLTPWLLLSYRLDWWLFGLQPDAFYQHQVVAILLVCVMLYLCLRLWLRREFAVAGVLLFLSGPPVAYLSQQLMTRHYLEGMIFMLAALYCHVRYLRGHDSRYWIVAGLAYLLAITAKEIYVPLPLLLLVLPEGNWRLRLRAFLPFLALIVLYVLWRTLMLGSVGGYSTGMNLLNPGFLLAAGVSLARIPQLLFADLWWLVAVLMALPAVGYFRAGQGRAWRAVLILGLVIGPLLPVVDAPGISSADRYLFLPWVLTVSAFALFAQSVYDRFAVLAPCQRQVIMGLALLLTLAASLPQTLRQRAVVSAVGHEFDAHAQFIRDHSAPVHYLPSPLLLTSFWYVEGMDALKHRYQGGASSPVPVIDPFFLTAEIPALYAFDQDCVCFVEDTDSLAQRLLQFNALRRPEAPLRVELSYLDRVFSWQLGPYDRGSWHFLSRQLGGVAQVPAAGQLRLYMQEGGRLHLRYTSPEGWVTYSDAIVITHPMQTITWLRQ